MPLYQLGESRPEIDPSAFVADGARLIGAVQLAAGSSVWFNAVLRADPEPIVVGARSNVQDGAVLHNDPGFPLRIGAGVTIGHQAMLHGCTVGDNSLIGIQAVVLNAAVIGRDCLVGAGALVTEGKQIPDRSLLIGSPAKVARQLSDDEVAQLRRSAQVYVERAARFARNLKRLDA